MTRKPATPSWRDDFAADAMRTFLVDISRQIAAGTMQPTDAKHAVSFAAFLSYEAADAMLAAKGRKR